MFVYMVVWWVGSQDTKGILSGYGMCFVTTFSFLLISLFLSWMFT
jgi:hypothetical protein